MPIKAYSDRKSSCLEGTKRRFLKQVLQISVERKLRQITVVISETPWAQMVGLQQTSTAASPADLIWIKCI